MKRDSRRLSMRSHREARRAEGYREMSVWLHDSLQKALDEQVATGRYRNRSEILAEAVQAYLNQQPTENATR